MIISTQSDKKNGSHSYNKVQDLDIRKPIDIKTALNLLGGNKKLYLNMLAKTE